MQIVIELNNPHFAAICEDMAAAVGLDAQTLCVGIVESQLEGYAKEVREAKQAAAAWRLPPRLFRLVNEQFEKEETTDA